MPPDALTGDLGGRINEINFLYARKQVVIDRINLATSQQALDYFL